MLDPARSEPIPETTVLRTENLGREVGGRVILGDVTMRVERGETFGVVGASGSGKSSFLRLLNRLDEPTSGAVFLEGVDYRLIPPRELRRKVGMVTQRPYLFPGSVFENLAFGPRQREEALSPAFAAELLAKVGLTDYAARDVAHLSGGEAQRVGLARALANSPTVLLLDEPTSALDEAAKLAVEDVIRELIRDRGLTCIFVTHDLAQAARTTDRIMVMDRGSVVRTGTAREILRA